MMSRPNLRTKLLNIDIDEPTSTPTPSLKKGQTGGSRVKSLARMSPTPSMTMLSEAAEALSQSPNALKKLADGTSTGGVYQLSRNQLQLCTSNPTPTFNFNNVNTEHDMLSLSKSNSSSSSTDLRAKNKLNGYISPTNSNNHNKSSSFNSKSSSMRSRGGNNAVSKLRKSSTISMSMTFSRSSSSVCDYTSGCANGNGSSEYENERDGYAYPYGVEPEVDFENEVGIVPCERESDINEHNCEEVLGRMDSKCDRSKSGSFEEDNDYFADEITNISTGVECVDIGNNYYPGSGTATRSRSESASASLCESETRSSYDDEFVSEAYAQMRSNMQRKRSFSASFATELQDEVKAVTSNVAIFKPADEETGWNKLKSESKVDAKHQVVVDGKDVYLNPERKGLVIGTGSTRERAAYLLESQYSILNQGKYEPLLSVPTTMLTKLVTRKDGVVTVKKGSLQKYVIHEDSADCRPDLASKAAALEVQKIGILDLRIFNTDRHGGNVLVSKVEEDVDECVRLWPIDNALSLPDFRYLSEAYFDWQYYPQAKQKFDELALEFINALDIEKDDALLANLGISEGSRLTNKLCTLALKVGANAGLTLYQLAQVYCRPFPAGHLKHDEYKSPLENMIEMALKQTQNVTALNPKLRNKRNSSTLTPKLMSSFKHNSSLLRKKIWPNASFDTEKSEDDNIREIHTTNLLHSVSNHGPEVAKDPVLERVKGNDKILQKYSTEAVVFDLILENTKPDVSLTQEQDMNNKINCEFDFCATGLETLDENDEIDPSVVNVKRSKSADEVLNVSSRDAKIERDVHANIGKFGNHVSVLNSLLEEPILKPGHYESDGDIRKIASDTEHHAPQSFLKDSVKIQQDFEIVREGPVFGEISFDQAALLEHFEIILKECLANDMWKKWLK